MSRDARRAAELRVLGARGAVCDVYDEPRLAALLTEERPEVVVDELSDLPRRLLSGHDRGAFRANDRIRTEGAGILVRAALGAGARRVVAQSYAHVYAPLGGWVKGEEAPLNLDPHQPDVRRRNVRSVVELEQTVLETPGLEGVALRYGSFYGPGTPFAWDGSIAAEVRRGRYSIVGEGQGMTSFVHVDDAAAATLLALAGPPGVYNICDDYPAREIDWLPFYADLLGAPPPRHAFGFLLEGLGHEHFVYRTLRQRGASNRKAKERLGLELCFPSWRQGFINEARAERGEHGDHGTRSASG
jgi:2-alkyl-3-oxoalkanoate reductase